MTRRRPENSSGHDALHMIEQRLGDLASAFKRAIEDVASAAQTARSSADRMADGSDRSPIQTHFDVKIGGISVPFADDSTASDLDATTHARRPAASRREATSTDRAGKQRNDTPPKPRAPHIDILDEEDGWTVIAELPGVAIEEVAVHAENGKLVLETTGARRFVATLDVPADVIGRHPEIQFANGILEARIRRAAV